MTYLPPGMSAANPTAQMLDQAPNSPEAGQQLLAMQQTQKLAEVTNQATDVGKLQRISDIARSLAAEQSSAEGKAVALAQGYAGGIQSNAGGGQAKLALLNSGSAEEIGRRLFG